MSQLINPLSVVDTALDVKDSIDFAVLKSGQNITAQAYNANSYTSNQVVFAIQVPSTSTLVSRDISVEADMTFVVSSANVPAGLYLWNSAGVNKLFTDPLQVSAADCFSPFVFNSLITSMTCQLNNTALVQNQVNQILDPILRGLPREVIEKWYGSTPTQLDYLANYNDALPENFAADTDFAAPITANAGYNARWNSPFNCVQNQNGKACESRASFELISVVNPVGADAAGTAQIRIKVREPLFLSPFSYGVDPTEEVCLTGITQLNWTIQLDSLATRAMRWINSNIANKVVQSWAFNSAPIMHMKYYTPPPTMLIPAVCVTPVQNFVNFQTQSIAATVAAGVADQITSASLQLNSIPDKVIVWIDDQFKYVPTAGGTPYALPGQTCSDHYGTITKVNITLANQTGILSTFDQKQLFNASLQSGSQQSWDEFSGLAHQGNGVNIGTCGSVLYLDFASVINLNEVFLAPGSLNTTQFLITVDYVNNTGQVIKPRLNTMFVYSGILSTSNGNSSIYLNGVLTKNDVLNSANAPHMVKKELNRYIGGGILSGLKSLAKSVLPKALPMARELLGNVDNKYAKLGAEGLKTLGYGKSGGVMASGRMASKMVN